MVKTEREFADFFIESTRTNQPPDVIQNIAKRYWTDLTSHLNTYFSNEDRLEITRHAGQLFGENLKTQPPELAWAGVIRDFSANHYWGHKTILRKPKIKQTEEQKIFWKLFKYAWAFFQSMVVLKIAVYYFGLESAYRPDEISVVWVWFFFFLSAGSLAFFAYRNRNDKD